MVELGKAALAKNGHKPNLPARESPKHKYSAGTEAGIMSIRPQLPKRFEVSDVQRLLEVGSFRFNSRDHRKAIRDALYRMDKKGLTQIREGNRRTHLRSTNSFKEFGWRLVTGQGEVIATHLHAGVVELAYTPDLDSGGDLRERTMWVRIPPSASRSNLPLAQVIVQRLVYGVSTACLRRHVRLPLCAPRPCSSDGCT